MPNPSKLNIGAAGCDSSNSPGSHAPLAGGSVRQPCQAREAHPFVGMPHETQLALRRRRPALGLA